MPAYFDNFDAINAFVKRAMPPIRAGPFAERGVRALRMENNVGGAHVCIPLPPPVQQMVSPTTHKRFNGASTCLMCGSHYGVEVRATALIFRPGSIQIVGASTLHGLRLLLHVYCDKLRAIGLRPHLLFISIDNIVATGSLGFSVSVEQLHGCMPGFITAYSPILFPGLVCMCYLTEPRLSLTLFEGGTCTVLGINNMPDALRAYFLLAQFAAKRKTALPTSSVRKRSHEREARRLEEESLRTLHGGRREAARGKMAVVEQLVARFMEQHAKETRSAALYTALQRYVDDEVAALEKREADERNKREAEAEERRRRAALRVQRITQTFWETHGDEMLADDGVRAELQRQIDAEDERDAEEETRKRRRIDTTVVP
jgi:TATA-box binding protein (TBP) (component of TFIID and TFIIIB)